MSKQQETGHAHVSHTAHMCSNHQAFKAVKGDVVIGRENERRNVDRRVRKLKKSTDEAETTTLHGSSLAPAKSFLHFLLYVLHLLSPLLAQALLVVSDDGRVPHEGDEPDAEQVGEARAQSLHCLAIALRVFQVDLQDGSTEQLAFPHHAVVQRVQVLVTQIVGVTLLKVVFLALAVLRPRLHHLHELSELVLQVLFNLIVLAVQRFLLDLHKRAAVQLGELVQPSVD